MMEWKFEQNERLITQGKKLVYLTESSLKESMTLILFHLGNGMNYVYSVL